MGLGKFLRKVALTSALVGSMMPFYAGATEPIKSSKLSGVERKVEQDCPYVEEWTKTFKEEGATVYTNDMTIDSNGDIVFAGYTSKNHLDVRVEKTGPNGNSKWVFEWGGEGQDIAEGVCTTQEQGETFHYVVGRTYSTENGKSDGFGLKLKDDGTSVLLKTFGGIKSDSFNSVCASENKGVYVAGYTSVSGGDSWILSLDEDLNTNWKKIPSQDKYESFANSICQAQEKDGFSFVGYIVDEYDEDILRIRLENFDSNGNQRFAKTLGTEYSHASKIIPLSGGGYALPGCIYYDMGDLEFHLMLVNSDGTSRGKQLTWGVRDNYNILRDACELNDEIISVGEIAGEEIGSNERPYVVGISKNLEFNWELKPENFKYSKFNCIESLPDKEGFIVAGNQGAGSEAFLIKYSLPTTDIKGSYWALY